MPTIDPRIDAYIQKAEPFAQPILIHLSAIVHEACPTVKGTIKWGFPHFEFENEILCSMAAFKQHCVTSFRKASLLKDPDGYLQLKNRAAMGQPGRIGSLKDLPPKPILKEFIKQAAQLNLQGIKVAASNTSSKRAAAIKIPFAVSSAIEQVPAAQHFFETLSPSDKREYIEWITEAKTAPTKAKRIQTMLEWLAEGKTRNWKYKK